MTKILGLITARGGSKGIPGKNIKPLAGKPLIAWTIEAANNSRLLSQVIVSTDDNEIARSAQAWGAEVPFKRPEELAQDQSSHLDVVLHALQWYQLQHRALPEYVMLLQPTSPLRTANDIDAAISLAAQKQADAITVSYTHLTLPTKRIV